LKKTKILASLTFSIAFINIVISLIMIPRFGLYGAAFGTISAFFFGFMGAFMFSVFSRAVAETKIQTVKL